MKMNGILVSILCLSFPIPLVAQVAQPSLSGSDSLIYHEESKPLVTSLNIYLEEDLFLFSSLNDDQNYTGGMAVTMAGRVADKLSWPLRFVNEQALGVLISDLPDMKTSSITFALTAFSPESIELTSPIVDDRPYASLAAIGFEDSHVYSSAWGHPFVVTTEANIGMSGLRIAEYFQKGIHDIARRKCSCSTPPDPAGWWNQIDDGGQLVGLVGAELRIAPRALTEGARRTFDLAGGPRIQVGYYDEVSLGLTARVGTFTSQFWEFKSDPMTGYNRIDWNRASTWELFVFGSIRTRYIWDNRFLTGPRPNVPTSIERPELEPLVTEFDLGLNLQFPAGSHLIDVAIVYPAGRTAEFNGPEARTHSWASLFFSISKS